MNDDMVDALHQHVHSLHEHLLGAEASDEECKNLLREFRRLGLDDYQLIFIVGLIKGELIQSIVYEGRTTSNEDLLKALSKNLIESEMSKVQAELTLQAALPYIEALRNVLNQIYEKFIKDRKKVITSGTIRES